jgi:hypothetical protein|tara:strand:- start:33411 stop:33722 length:312 start_codon:yes stop_codon:yes gene_type:complete
MNLLRAFAPLGLLLATGLMLASPAAAAATDFDDPIALAEAAGPGLTDAVLISVEDFAVMSLQSTDEPGAGVFLPQTPVSYAPIDAIPIPALPHLDPPLSLAPV